MEQNGRPNRSIISRTLIVMAVCGILAFIVLGVRLYQLMILEHEYYEEEAIAQQTRSSTVTASRGTIYDRNGTALAVSATAYTIVLSPHEMELYGEDPAFVAEGLSRILGVDYDRIMELSKKTNSWYEIIARQIEPELADEVREFKASYTAYNEEGKKEYSGLRSVRINEDSKRYYPYGSLASHVIGFTGTDNVGLDGLESLYDSYLTGTNGSTVRLTASNGVDLLYENFENYNDATDGYDLTLTIDTAVQGIAEKYLDQAIEDNYIKNGGCAIVMDVETGEILAMVDANDYDLNSPWTLDPDIAYELENIQDEAIRSKFRRDYLTAQWRNMCVSDTYEPGSVFKIITMAMALEEGAVTLDEDFWCDGHIDAAKLNREDDLHCWKRNGGHGHQTLREAAMHSCNVAFANIALKVGAQRFYQYVEAFGLWDRTGIDVLGEAGTRSLWWNEDYFFSSSGKSSLAVASFGQTCNVTPIQMITAVAACVNGGYLMEPYVVSRVTDEDGAVVYSHEPTVVRQVLSNETSSTVASILESVVGDEGGTGGNAYVAGYRVGGKTGTTTKTTKESETGVREYMVSFCGIAPANDPKIAVLVVLDNPDQNSGVYVSGGVMAAPTVGKIISEVLPYLGVEPQYTEEEQQYVDVTMPRCVGDSVATARSKVINKGLNLEVIGDGSTITAQVPAANSEISPKSRVILYAGSEPPADAVTMPNVINLSANMARVLLEEKGIYMESTGALPENGNIIVSKQSVQSGVELPYGSVVHVTLIDKTNLGRY